MRLDSLVQPDRIYLDLPGADRPTVLRAMAEKLASAGAVSDADELYRRISEREALGTTALGAGVAIPHCKMEDLDEVLVAIGICANEIDFFASDGKPVRLLFMVVSPDRAPAAHLQSLAAISKWVKADEHVERILDFGDAEAIHRMLREETT